MSDVEHGSVAEANTIYGTQDFRGELSWTNECPKGVVDAAEDEETARYAVVVRSTKSKDPRRKFEAHSMVIQSPLLKKALGDILEGYPGVSCDLERLVFNKPFEPLVHRWPELQKYLDRDDLDVSMKEHLSLLSDTLTEELGQSIKVHRDYLSKGVTTFEDAWMLFQPGSVVLSEWNGPLSALKLVKMKYADREEGRVLELDCDYVSWGGNEFWKANKQLEIAEFKGVEKVTNLSAFPMSFHEEKEDVEAKLIARGKEYEGLSGYHFKQYSGVAFAKDERGRDVAIHHDGRIMIDAKGFNANTNSGPFPYDQVDYRERRQVTRIRPKKTFDNLFSQESGEEEAPASVLDDDLRLLCTSRVCGYSLPLKMWLSFFVHLVEEIVWSSRAFDSLVLPANQKELILSFAESQVEHRKGFDDVVCGKGQGIIILLSGKPGIGKTLTAESMAEVMRRPLHTISPGDLGNDLETMEYKLKKVFDLVGRWNAVLLIDECDVFLEARSVHEMHRNACVSLFLRHLEYYNGILFMTTNRAVNIDPAFESRIHISMNLPELDAASRKKVWRNLLSTRQHDILESDLKELSRLKFNGRQIKNILKISHLLASHKKRNLRMKDIHVALDIENKRPEKRLKEHTASKPIAKVSDNQVRCLTYGSSLATMLILSWLLMT